jgi:GTP cyclohydrolase IA
MTSLQSITEHLKPKTMLAQACRMLIECIGEDSKRDGLQETPDRFAQAWDHWTSGYKQNPDEVMKTFEATDYDEMVVMHDIPIYSHCEHHLAAIFGTATVGYVPQGRILGLSKIARVADIYARRLQVQERLTVQIADALMESGLKPLGVGVVLKCRHMCLESRGVQKTGTITKTSALRGVMFNGDPRNEFLRLAQ